jgi:NDP-sugar pyrophosphorylase family protein
MLKIIIPIAGPSDLFINAGFQYPKPLIELNGKMMIEHVVNGPSLITSDSKFIFIVKEEDIFKFHLDNTLKILCPECEIVSLKRLTKGSLCSVLMATDKIDDDDSLLILNGDQILDIDYNVLLSYWKKNNSSAGVVTFKSLHPRWSYAIIENDVVLQTAEKNPISNHSIAGYYYFSKASEFFEAAFLCIKNEIQVDGNFYISPVLNQYVLQNRLVSNFTVDNSKYHSFYSPQMLSDYERSLKH